MNIIFDKLKENYISSLYELEKECFSVPWSENSLREEIDNPNARFIVALCGNEVVGYIGSHNILGEVYITNIAVFKSYRRNGIGKLLLEKLKAVSLEESADFITLEVRESNEAAIKLYEKMNFKQVGIRKGFYENPKEDALLMTLYLDGVK